MENVGPTHGDYTLRSADPANPATINGYYFIRTGSSNVTLQYLKIDGTNTVLTSPLRIFGDDVQILDSDVTNGHYGESCILVGNYEGLAQDVHPVYRTKILRNRIHSCGSHRLEHDHGIYDAYGYYTEIADNVIEDQCCGFAVQMWTSAWYGLIHHNLFQDLHDGGNARSDAGSGVIFASDRDPNTSYNIVEYNISRRVDGYHASEYWQNQGDVGVGNEYRYNCLDTAGMGDYLFRNSPPGYSQYGNVHQADCTGYGPR